MGLAAEQTPLTLGAEPVEIKDPGDFSDIFIHFWGNDAWILMKELCRI